MESDFSRYSLALFKDGKLIHSSDHSHVRPIFECVKQFKGKLEGCELHDKVIGLAAARLIVFGSFIDKIKTLVVSEPAKRLLDEAGILIEAKQLAPHILNNEGKGICPMEKRALAIKSNAKFYNELESIYY